MPPQGSVTKSRGAHDASASQQRVAMQERRGVGGGLHGTQGKLQTKLSSASKVFT